MAEMHELSRQRLDYSVGPNGETIAKLTVTLGDGSVHRYEAESTDQEVNELAKVIANAEMRQLRISGQIAGWSDDEISGFFDKVFKAVKSVAKVARKVASSKVFKMAGKGLLMVAPALGPFAPAAMAVGGGMTMASKLADASIAAEAGAKRVSRMFSSKAKKHGRSVTRRRGSWIKMLNWANHKRKAMAARAENRTPPAAPAPAPRREKKAKRKKMATRIWRARALACRAAARRRAQPWFSRQPQQQSWLRRGRRVEQPAAQPSRGRAASTFSRPGPPVRFFNRPQPPQGWYGRARRA